MNDVTERLSEYLKEKKVSPNKAETTCGLSRDVIRKALIGNTSLRSDSLEKILNTYQDLSAEWLLRGTGSMIIGDDIEPEQVFRTLHMPPNSDKIIEVWMNFMECTKGMQELYRQSHSGTFPVQNP